MFYFYIFILMLFLQFLFHTLSSLIFIEQRFGHSGHFINITYYYYQFTSLCYYFKLRHKISFI